MSIRHNLTHIQTSFELKGRTLFQDPEFNPTFELWTKNADIYAPVLNWQSPKSLINLNNRSGARACQHPHSIQVLTPMHTARLQHMCFWQDCGGQVRHPVHLKTSFPQDALSHMPAQKHEGVDNHQVACTAYPQHNAKSVRVFGKSTSSKKRIPQPKCTLPEVPYSNTRHGREHGDAIKLLNSVDSTYDRVWLMDHFYLLSKGFTQQFDIQLIPGVNWVVLWKKPDPHMYVGRLWGSRRMPCTMVRF